MELELERRAELTDAGVTPEPGLTLHHIGVLVHALGEAMAVYRQMGASIGEPVTISSQGVRVCFADMKGSVAIELVEAAANGVAKSLLKRGMTYYHLGYTAADFDAALESLEGSNYVLLQSFQSEAFNGRRCAFLMSPVRHLIEIIERG
jgi:methylmalonyl-CoA/ethylmalonyl-CoA epimerase